MKNTLATFLSAVVLGLAAQTAHAAVVVSNIDPSTTAFGENSPEIGEALLTGTRPITLTSVEILQTGGAATGESIAVYSRNADGTLGTSLFTSFSLSFDSTTSLTSATVTGAFTLQANTGYFFVLDSNASPTASWTYTSSTDYAAEFGATLPANDTAFFVAGGALSYRSLSGGPQEFQVNGTALAAVPEPSTWALTSLALAGGMALLARRRKVAA